LQLALSGVRDLSLIATAPIDRLAVRTFVTPFDPLVVREALLREKYRGGQAYYVAPRLSDLPDLERFLREQVPDLHFSVSATTRDRRPGEVDGVDYHFLTREEFNGKVKRGEFVEHADYAGRSYGTLRSELEARVHAGVPVVLEIEVQGARQVREAMPEALQVFIAPPSLSALRTRLVGRGTDDQVEVERRLRVAEEELTAQPEFAHVVVNDRLEEALERLTSIVADSLD